MMLSTNPGTSEIQMLQEKKRVTLSSVAAAIFLTAMKLAVGITTGSLGILSEALHSALDLLAAVVTFFAVRVADKPPDREHQFGHGKVENLSALFETVLLLITCGWIMYEAVNRLTSGHTDIVVNFYSFAVIIISIIVDYSRSKALYRVAKKYNSQAIEADALHFQTDIYSSTVVLFGLLTVQLGIPEADAVAAAIVAVIVVWISVRLGKRTVDALLDRVPTGLEEIITNGIREVDGVESIRSLRIRSAGAGTFVNLVIGIQRTTFFDQAHSIVDTVEDTVRDLVPRTDILVHAEPVTGVRERFSDSIEWAVRQSGLTAHNILILWANEKFLIDFDIEYPQGTSFLRAHEQATIIELRIRSMFDHVSGIHIHMEEESAEALPATDVTHEETMLVARIRSLLAEMVEVKTCMSLSCYTTPEGMKINLSVSLTTRLSLKETHNIVDGIETEIRLLDPEISKVFIHAIPEDIPDKKTS